MTVLYFIPLVILLMTPKEALFCTLSAVRSKLKRETLIDRGETLLFWLDSFGLNGPGFDLGVALPPEDIYKSFGLYIHLAWQRVQQRGGELNPYFRVIKSLLRVDIKRQTKEKDSLNLVKFQILTILALVWAFLISLSRFSGEALKFKELGLIFIWQVFGVLIGLTVIRKLKRKYFSPVAELLELLLKLHSLRFNGNLSHDGLDSDLAQRDRQAGLIFRRMLSLLQRWKLQGQGDSGVLEELLEDIIALSQQRSEKFLKVTPLFFFIWCCAFVLPIMFAATVLGLAGHLNV